VYTQVKLCVCASEIGVYISKVVCRFIKSPKVDLDKLKSVELDEVKRPHPSKEEMLQIIREFPPGDKPS
jgi:hypothetical protein